MRLDSIKIYTDEDALQNLKIAVNNLNIDKTKGEINNGIF